VVDFLIALVLFFIIGPILGAPVSAWWLITTPVLAVPIALLPRDVGRYRRRHRARPKGCPVRRRLLWLGVLALVAVLAYGVPAGAHRTDQPDPNDTAGRLDLEAVGFDHVGAPRWRFATFATWSVRSMWERGYLLVQLDTRGDAGVDFVAVVRSDGRRLVAHLFRVRRGGGQAGKRSLRRSQLVGLGPNPE
jgi:hypothetical protein